MAHSLANFHGDTISLDANVLVGVIDSDAVLEPVMAIDIESMRGEMRTSGILPRDAIHVSVMKRLGLTDIASDDEGFENRQDINVYQP